MLAQPTSLTLSLSSASMQGIGWAIASASSPRIRHAWILLLLLLGVGCRASAPVQVGRVPSGSHWVGTWTAAPQPPLPGEPKRYQMQTLRLVIHTSVGGAGVRVVVSNAFGDEPVHVGEAHVARRTEAANIDPRSDRTLRFDGQTSFDVPAHGVRSSDPADLEVPAFSDVAVSLFLPQPTRVATTHILAQQTSYVSPAGASAAGAALFPVLRTIDDRPFLTGLEVLAPPRIFAVVTFGDSIVDGDGSTANANRRFNDLLAARLARAGAPGGVLNEGIIGNRLLFDSPRTPGGPFGDALGPSALARFDRDALGQAGVKAIIIRSGTCDIGFPGALAPAAERASASEMEAGYTQLVARARERGLRVVGATLPPFEGATLDEAFFTSEKESLRQTINAWIRTAGAFDGVIDFDRVLADPGHLSRLSPAFDSGDHLHPNDAGYAAVVEAVALKDFRVLP
jgi:lysophospholipase L1-like esterase